MNVRTTPLPGVLVIEPKRFRDDRGYFMETFHAERYAQAGIPGPFVQDNVSHSVKGTLRGLHFQEPRPQGKLVLAIRGAIYDVAVDIRKGSPTFSKWFAAELTEENGHQLWVPPGFAHGFCVLSDEADVLYKCTDVYVPEYDAGIRWDDSAIGISWPVQTPLLSKKDAGAPTLGAAPRLPKFVAA